jgi:hypothetical protein
MNNNEVKDLREILLKKRKLSNNDNNRDTTQSEEAVNEVEKQTPDEEGWRKSVTCSMNNNQMSINLPEPAIQPKCTDIYHQVSS